MKYLADVVAMPFITVGGRIVRKPGYDDETGVYLHLPLDWRCDVPMAPTPDDVKWAFDVMMRPWSAYGWATRDDAAAMVSAVLAAVSLPALSLCPLYLLGAAQQGSGKTKAAGALGALIEGQRPAITPYASTREFDDELRKKLLASAISGTRFQCLDNCVGFLRSSALSGVLTSGSLRDRVLGKSQEVTVKVRALLTLTANNLSVDADLMRRMVSVRIDAGERPTHRAFAFDPVAEALTQRRSIAEAALTILRAYFSAGAPDVVPGDAGGFSAWNRLARQPVLWLAREGIGWPMGDPAAAMLADPADCDPETEADADRLRALYALSGGEVFDSRQVVQWWRAGEHANDGEAAQLLRESLADVYARGQEPTPKSMGRILMYRRDRPLRGLKLIAKADTSASARLWRVVQTGCGSAPV